MIDDICSRLKSCLLTALVGIGAVSCHSGSVATRIPPGRGVLAPGDIGDTSTGDSAALLQLPRRIRGIVFDSVSGHRGVPVGNTRIRLHLGSPERVDSVSADAFGRYEVKNPPVGRLVMVAYCPSTPTWTGTVNGVVFMDVQAAMDTVVNIAVDPPNCPEPPPTQRRDTRWVNTHGRMNAEYPTGDAAAVYRVVIDYLYASERKPYVLLRDPTQWHCFGPDCGERELFRMVRSGVLDSSAVRNFAIATVSKISLTPEFGYSDKVVLLTDGDLDYIRHEEQRWRDIGQLPTGSDTSGLRTFRFAFPGAPNVVFLSGVGFNRTRSEALVEAGKSPSPYPEKSQLMLLKNANGTWRIVDEDIGKTRTTGSWKGDKCVVAEAPVESPSRSELESLSGEYELVAMRNGTTKKRYMFTLVAERTDSVSRFPFIKGGQRSRLEILADGPIKSELPSRARLDSAVPRFTLLYDGKIAHLHTSEPLETRTNLGPGWSFEIARVFAGGFSGRWSYFSATMHINEFDGPSPLLSSDYFCVRAVRMIR